MKRRGNRFVLHAPTNNGAEHDAQSQSLFVLIKGQVITEITAGSLPPILLGTYWGIIYRPIFPPFLVLLIPPPPLSDFNKLLNLASSRIGLAHWSQKRWGRFSLSLLCCKAIVKGQFWQFGTSCGFQHKKWPPVAGINRTGSYRLSG